ncbi:Putative CAMK/CAMKL/PASK protein kinase [Rhizopus microsporus]|nr:Putative CAMK/CAMKL/PASK protein kinase [Rhizopus microsporus]
MELVRKMKWNNEEVDEQVYHRRLSQPNMEENIGFIQLKNSFSTDKRASLLHTPTRYLPQNQAIITTNSEGITLLFNDIAALCFGIDKSFVGKSFIKNCLEEPFKHQIMNLLNSRKKYTNCVQKVIICGSIVLIHKRNNTKSYATVWLKEKITEHRDKIYIWIFEEIYETTLSVYVDSECKIQRILGTLIEEMYGYKANEIIGKPVNCLVPALAKEERDDNLEKIDRLKFFGSLSSKGVYFPAILNLNRHVAIGNDDLANFVVKITSLPSISGSITFNLSTGLILQMNTLPAKYLFGYTSVDMIINKLTVNELIPQLPTLIENMLKNNLMTANYEQCRKLSSSDSLFYVYHRDKSKFIVELEIKIVDKDSVHVWVTFDRSDAVLKHDNLKQSYQKKIVHCPLKLQQQNDQPSLEANKKPKRPIVRPYRISSFGAVDEAKRLFPSNYFKNINNTDTTNSNNNNSNNNNDHIKSNSESKSSSSDLTQKKKHPLDDYVILDVLGQGTYGMAKLAYRKDDPSQKKLVIKYIIKSKIIVDSWIRDRQLGSIPMEIHILRTLQKYPHVNCCRLVTSMEDDDCYFVVMELLGDGMDLFDYIELNKKMTENEIRHIFYQIAKAVKHLHSHKIVHRDIKDENVILDQDGTVHLIDFGCATYYKEGRKFDTFTGTLEYCAPEVLKGKPYAGPPQDIWASGVLLFTLIYRENPFYNIDEILESELRVPFVLSEGSLDLIKKMLNRDVEKRINIDQVLDHPWFHPLTEKQQQ